MHELTSQFLDAQLAGDRQRGLSIIERALAEGVAVPEIHLGLIQAAQKQIGELWQDNRISIAQEHVATAISNLALAQLYGRLPRRPANGKLVLLACIEGELHEMGARIASDFLEMAGFDVRYVGANVPTESLLKLVESVRPNMVALSITMPVHASALRRAVEALRAANPTLPIAAGGYAFDAAPDLGQSLGMEYHGKDAAALVAMAERVLGVA